LDGIDLPFEDGEYEEIVAREFPNTVKKSGININWKMAVGLLVVVAMLIAFVFRC